MKAFKLDILEGLRGGVSESAGKLTVTVIKPGLSKNNRYYSESMLRRDVGIFKGAKMFSDHQTDAEQRVRPEGSIANWVANVGEAWAESNGTVKAVAVVIDPVFKQKLENLRAAGQLDSMGISIRCVGEAYDGEQDGKACKIIESLQSCRSVDFVTFAAAGGRVDALESDRAMAAAAAAGDPTTVQARLVRSFQNTGMSLEEACHAAHVPFDETVDKTQTATSQEFNACQKVLASAGYTYDGWIKGSENGVFKKGNIRVFVAQDGTYQFEGTAVTGRNANQLYVDVSAVQA